MAYRAYIYMRLGPLKLFLPHLFVLPLERVNNKGYQR
jgi:hypothetical protein